MNSTKKQVTNVYAFPIVMKVNYLWKYEIFVTFEEPNFFEEPYDSIFMKLAGTICWCLGLISSIIIYCFVIYEKQGYAASFRTVINQLVTYCYLWVSLLQSAFFFFSITRRINVSRLLFFKMLLDLWIWWELGLGPSQDLFATTI